jgi:hypothetical protein
VILLCIMAYSMSQRLVGVGISGHLPTHLVLHIVLVLVLVPLLFPENIDRTPLQAEPFVAEGTGNSNLGNFILACVHSHSLGTSSVGEPRKPGVKVATGLIVTVCLVQCALVFGKRRQSPPSLESRIPEIPPQATSLTNGENAKDPIPPHRSTGTMWRLRPSAWKMDADLFFSMSVPNRV